MAEEREDADGGASGASAAEQRLPHLRAFAIAFGVLNAFAAAAAIFGAVVYIGEAGDRRLQRDTFEALAVEMLFARLDRARGTGSNASDVLQRLNAFGVRVRDINLTDLIFIEPPARLDPVVLLHGDNWFIACPFGSDSGVGVDGAGRILNCSDVSNVDIDVRNPVRLEMANVHLTDARFYCRAGSSVHFIIESSLVRPTFNCRRDQVAFLRGSVEPTDARWCHPDDYPSRDREDGPPVYASGPCEGEPYPSFLEQNQDQASPATP